MRKNKLEVVNQFKNKIIKGLFFIFKLIPINNKKVVVSNYYGKGYGDNPKYIVSELLSTKKDYDIVWLVLPNKNYEFPNGIRPVKYSTLRSIYELATAKIWIDNCRKFSSITKRENQFYIQTWHGGIALKKIEKDTANTLTAKYTMDAICDSKMVNLMISNSKFNTALYNTSFWYEGDILEVGSPRCDIIFNTAATIKEKVQTYFNFLKDVNIVLYAPTFRNNEDTDIYKMDFELLRRNLNLKFGNDWIVLIRLHPNISEKNTFMDYTDHIINASEYEDMYELMAVSDILITDYSSTMFEFSMIKKPVFLYAPDFDEYIEERNFYFDIMSLPYPLSLTFENLIINIQNYEESNYHNELEKFYEQISLFENGEASRTVANLIQEITTERIESRN